MHGPTPKTHQLGAAGLLASRRSFADKVKAHQTGVLRGFVSHREPGEHLTIAVVGFVQILRHLSAAGSSVIASIALPRPVSPCVRVAPTYDARMADHDDPMKRFERTIACALFAAARDGSLRKRLTDGVREAREAMSEDDQEQLDAEVERTIAWHGVEEGGKRQ
jgi:hypothetical protein